MREARLPEVLLCDIGGVLIKVQWPYVADYIANAGQSDYDETLRLISALSPRLDLGLLTVQQLCSQLIDELRLRVSPDELVEVVLYRSQHFLGENFDYLLDFKHRRKVVTVAASNVSREISIAQRKAFPLDRLFDGYIRSCDLGIMKPDRMFFLEALRRLSKEPNRCFLVDDLEESVRTAEALGIPGLFVRKPGNLIPSLSALFDHSQRGGRSSEQ